MNLPIPNIHLHLDASALLIASDQPLNTLSSAIVGGGLTQARYILNMHVHKDYSHPDPALDLIHFARKRGVDEAFVGLMTAAYVERARLSCMQEDELNVCAVLTAGLGNVASVGISKPAPPRPGTINMILLIDASLEPAAMVNAAISATEAKCDVLRRFDRRTAEGEIATGTSSDAIVVACTGRGRSFRYAGPATLPGYLVGRAVRQALSEAIA